MQDSVNMIAHGGFDTALRGRDLVRTESVDKPCILVTLTPSAGTVHGQQYGSGEYFTTSMTQALRSDDLGSSAKCEWNIAVEASGCLKFCDYQTNQPSDNQTVTHMI